MTMQARMSAGDDRLYNPARDVAHCFGDIARETARRLEEARWPWLRGYLTHYNVTDDQLGEASRAFLEFVATATDSRDEKAMCDAMIRVGWFDVPEPAQFAWLALLGTVVNGYFWIGVHEATIGGTGPCSTFGDLALVGRRTSRLMAMPRWKRTLAAIKYRARLWVLKKLNAEPIVTPLMAHLDYDTKVQEVRRQQGLAAARAEAARNRAGASSHEGSPTP